MDVPVRSQLHGIETFLVEAKTGFGTAKRCHGSIAQTRLIRRMSRAKGPG